MEITVDAFPGVQFHGHVDSIQTGSGAAFSLLPPENATGNYVKIVQRVPVKIVFENASLLAGAGYVGGTNGDGAMSETTAAPEWRPAANPWLIAVAAMLATFMEVLDTSVANVSLPHIAGSLSATNEEATWVLTNYLISNAIILPATGWLGGRFGRKRFLLSCIAIFTLSSAFCGTATSLSMLILGRILQGGGGALQPISQAVLLESFPPSAAAWRWGFLPWALWSRRSSGRRSAAGSPTIIHGAGYFTLTCRLACLPS